MQLTRVAENRKLLTTSRDHAWGASCPNVPVGTSSKLWSNTLQFDKFDVQTMLTLATVLRPTSGVLFASIGPVYWEVDDAPDDWNKGQTCAAFLLLPSAQALLCSSSLALVTPTKPTPSAALLPPLPDFIFFKIFSLACICLSGSSSYLKIETRPWFTPVDGWMIKMMMMVGWSRMDASLLTL